MACQVRRRSRRRAATSQHRPEQAEEVPPAGGVRDGGNQGGGHIARRPETSSPHHRRLWPRAAANNAEPRSAHRVYRDGKNGPEGAIEISTLTGVGHAAILDKAAGPVRATLDGSPSWFRTSGPDSGTSPEVDCETMIFLAISLQAGHLHRSGSVAEVITHACCFCPIRQGGVPPAGAKTL